MRIVKKFAATSASEDTLSREFHESIDSTQERALALARDGCPDGTSVWAAHQTAGRGRLDHRWDSPRGGLYLSRVVRHPRAGLPMLSLAIGLRLREMLANRYHIATSIKWPNDILLADGRGPRKLAGILVDLVEIPGRPMSVVAGVGLNVAAPREDFPSEMRGSVASLSDVLHPPPEPSDLVGFVESSIDSAAAWVSEPSGRTEVVEELRLALYGVGRPAIVDGRLVGTLRGVTDEGALQVEGPEGAKTFEAGDLVLGE